MGRQLLRWLQEALLLKDHRCEGIGPLAPCGADYGVGDSIQEQEGLDEQMTAADGLQPGTVILLSKNGKIRDNLRPATRVSLVWALDEEHPTVITATLGGGGDGRDGHTRPGQRRRRSLSRRRGHPGVEPGANRGPGSCHERLL